MPLVSTGQILNHAVENGYAVGAFVCMNLEMINAAIQAAEAEMAPVVIRIHPDIRCITKLSTVASVVRQVAGESPVPVALSLDHGRTLADVAEAINAGFSGVMIDAAEWPLVENIHIVKKVVELAKPIGVLVEASIGNMPHGEQQYDKDLADVEDAQRLVAETGVDILAPAVGNVHGTAHGESKADPRLDLERIRAIRAHAGVPVCLHGGSSIPKDQMAAAVDAGVHMVIIYTDVVAALNRELRRVLGSSEEAINILLALKPALHASVDVIRDKMHVLGSSGQARSMLMSWLANA